MNSCFGASEVKEIWKVYTSKHFFSKILEINKKKGLTSSDKHVINKSFFFKRLLESSKVTQNKNKVLAAYVPTSGSEQSVPSSKSKQRQKKSPT